MSLLNRLSGIVNLRPEERSSFRQLFLISLITGIGLSYYFVAVNTFLIKKASVSNLPFAYIISGIGGVFLIKLYQQRQKKRGIAGSYRESLIAFFAVAMGVFFAFSQVGESSAYAVYLAYLGFLFNMPFTIIFALSFSAICARLYNLGQSKRLLGLVGTGEIVASIIGYLTAPVISKLAGSPDYLLPLAALCILPALIPISRIVKGSGDKLSHSPAAKATLKKLNFSFFRQDRFYFLIALVSLFSVAAIYFVDYTYLISVRLMAEYSGLEIASVLGFFFSLLKVGELIFSFLSGHILGTRGVKFSILLLPLILTGCFALAGIGSLAFKNELVFILSFLMLAKFAERVIRKTILSPATRVIYQVTGPDRLRIEATIEGVLNQVATVMSGVLLLVLSTSLSSVAPQQFLGIISLVCFIVFLMWSGISLRLHEQYKLKIWSYLREVKPVKQPKAVRENGSDDKFCSASKIIVHPDLKEKLNDAMEMISGNEHSPAIDSLALYVPSLLNQSDPQGLYRKIIGSYFSNDSFFYRFFVVNYLKAKPEGFNHRLLRELGEISDLQLRIELTGAFNTYGVKPGPSEAFYFENLCEKYANELVLALSARHNLQEIEDKELQTALRTHSEKITRLLFELLKVLYDPSAIQAIYEIIRASDESQDIENRLFALELLDNTVNDHLKQRLIPIFEPAPFDQKIRRLQQFVPFFTINKELQLRELLMKDFTLIDPGLKEACLRVYYGMTGDQQLLKAFAVSRIKNLRSLSNRILNGEIEGNKEKLIAGLKSTFNLNHWQTSYMYNQASINPGEPRTGVFFSGKGVAENPYILKFDDGSLLDVYGLAVFVKMNQSGA